MKIVPVILSGGSGTRLWPLSRANSILSSCCPWSALSPCCRTRCAVLDGLGHRAAHPGVQRGAPLSRGRAVARAGRGATIHRAGACRPETPHRPSRWPQLQASPDALLLVLPADHVIRDIAAFQAAVRQAIPAAEAGKLVTFGIVPTGADDWIRVHQAGRGRPVAWRVCHRALYRKNPSPTVPEPSWPRGAYSWNSGMFLFKAGRFLEELRAHAPDIDDAAAASLNGRDHRSGFHPARPALVRSLPQ